MKTNFKTSITVFALAFAGVLSANATVNFGEKNSGLFPGNENLSVLNEKTTSFESELNENIDYRMEAQMVTRMIADMAEAKATQKVIERGFVAPQETSNSVENQIGNENGNEITDFGKEAQLITKSIADMEEAKAVQKVMERGFVAPIGTTCPFENEVVNEFNSEITDFGKEAQLTTKSIADMEEAKAVQKVTERGFVAPIGTTSSFENEVVNELNSEITDFGKEAQLMTRLIVDKEEAKVIQKLFAQADLEETK